MSYEYHVCQPLQIVVGKSAIAAKDLLYIKFFFHLNKIENSFMCYVYTGVFIPRKRKSEHEKDLCHNEHYLSTENKTIKKFRSVRDMNH